MYLEWEFLLSSVLHGNNYPGKPKSNSKKKQQTTTVVWAGYPCLISQRTGH